MPDSSLTPEATIRGDRDPANFEPSIEGTERHVRRILDALREQDTVPFRELERLGEGLLNTLAEAGRLREERERARRAAVELEQQLALATVLEIQRPGTAIPLQLRRSYAGGDRWAVCDREGRRWHSEHDFVYEAQNVREQDRTDTRFPLAEALDIALQIAAGGTR